MHPISFTHVGSFVLKGHIATGLITGLWRVMCSFYKAYQLITHLTTENLKRLDLERKGIPICLIILVKSIFIECGSCRRLLCVCVCVSGGGHLQVRFPPTRRSLEKTKRYPGFVPLTFAPFSHWCCWFFVPEASERTEGRHSVFQRSVSALVRAVRRPLLP